MGGEDGVVRLNNGGGGLRSGVNAELELALLSVVDRQTLHQQSAETRTGTTTKRVEDEEALKTSTAVGDAADLVEHAVNKLLAHGVVATSVVVGGILLASDHVLRVEQASVGASPDLVDNVGLEIAVDGSWNVFTLAYIVYNALDELLTGAHQLQRRIPVSEKKVLKPWSGSAALRSSVRYPSGWKRSRVSKQSGHTAG